MECGAALDVWQIMHLLSKPEFDWGKHKLKEVVAILSSTLDQDRGQGKEKELENRE